ncbi:MAG: c-type cytochrome [bacterium]
MKKLVLAASLSLAAMTAAPSFAGDVEAGKAKAAMCAACHGAEGISAMDMWPNLAGQKAGYLVKQLKAFRDGTRADPSMAPMAAGLTDQDIDNLAAFYASLK